MMIWIDIFHTHFDMGIQQILRTSASPVAAFWQCTTEKWYHDFYRQSFADATDVPCSVNVLAYEPLNPYLWQCHLGVRLCLCILILKFQLRILKMTEIHQWRKMNFSALIPCFFDHLLLVSDFCQLPCRDFLSFSHSFSTAAFASGIL